MPNFKSITFTSFIHLTKEEHLFCLNLYNQDNIRLMMRSTEVITLDDHLRYVESLRNNCSHFYFMISVNDEPVGVCSFKAINKDQGIWESGWYFATKIAGSSRLARLFALRLYALLGIRQLDNVVLRTNIAAVHMAKMEGCTFYEEEGQPQDPDWIKTRRIITDTEIADFLQDQRFHTIDCHIIF